MQRGRFHLGLAAMGKTEMTDKERELLSRHDRDGGHRVPNLELKNPVFLYHQQELGERYVWDELADFLEVPFVPNNKEYKASQTAKANATKINICDSQYDPFRARFMIYSYELSTWLLHYLIPVAERTNRTDVVLPRLDRFKEVAVSYQNDPCGALERSKNGTYVLKTGLPLVWPAEQERWETRGEQLW